MPKKKYSCTDVTPTKMTKPKQTFMKTYRKTVKSLVKSKIHVPEDACLFCFGKTSSDETGQLIYHKHSGFHLHYFCLLFASGLEQSSSDCDSLDDPNAIHGFLLDDIVNEFARGSRLRCCYCFRVCTTIGCAVEKCKTKYHFMCGLERSALFQYTGCFTSYCKSHRPTQTHLLNENASLDLSMKSCCICLEAFENTVDMTEALILPCCNDTWLHRTCVQKQALSCGCYFFRCPTCNNKDKFCEEMLRMGIYVPTRDALWETPEAYSDLTQQYHWCDITTCKCRKGRTYSKPRTKYEILVCKSCGISGAHIACVDGVISKSFKCDICIQVDGAGHKGKNSSSNDDSKIAEETDLDNGDKESVTLKRKTKDHGESSTGQNHCSPHAKRRRSSRLQLKSQ